MALSDEILVKQCLDGNKGAFGFLVDKYKGAVHALAYHKLGNFHDAEEVAQETFLKAYQRLSSLRNPCAFAGWLYVICANCCRGWMRERRKKKEAVVPLGQLSKGAIADSSYAEYTHQMRVQSVREAVDNLPESEKTVVSLHYLGGLSSREISRFLGISPGAARMRLYRARERLRKEMLEMLEQTWSGFGLCSDFTFQLMKVIHRTLPLPPPKPTTTTRWVPIGTLMAILILGISLQFYPYDSPLTTSDATLEAVYPILVNGPTIPGQIGGIESASTPPASEENVLYTASEGPEEATANGEQNGGLQCRLSPGDILTYEVHREVLSRDRISYTVEGTRSLLVTDVWDDEMRIIKANWQDNFIRGGQKASSFGDLGFLYVKRNGHADWREGVMFFSAELQQLDGDLYFVSFPSKPLKQGDIWVDNSFRRASNKEPVPAKYTVVGFGEVKGHRCVLLDRQQTLAATRELRSSVACDVESGMIIEFDSELKVRKHAEKEDKAPRYSIERLTVELTEKEQLSHEALAMEKQVFDRIESAFEAHRYVEPEALCQKLEKIKKQYPKTRLMMGLKGMMAHAKGIIAAREEDAERQYTYRDQMYTIARLLTIQYEMNGKYMKYVPGTSMQDNKRTPFYEYEIIDIEGTGSNSRCKIVARGKKGTPAEGEAWFRTVSASEGIGEIQRYVEASQQ